MKRIEEWQCFMMDMEWYGTDKKGNIAVFCSAGEGYLPEFVCEDRDRADLLIDFFEKYQKYTQSVVLHKMTDFATQAARDFSDKGLYYFDSDDGTRYNICTLHKYYTKASYPEKPLHYNMLPKNIKELLKYNIMDIEDFANYYTISVRHAYKT